MDVFTNLLGPIMPLINYFPREDKYNENNIEHNKASINNQQYADYLNNLSVEEINAIIKKYITFDDNNDTSKKIIQSFLILLSIPCATMFFILSTQHVSIFLKILIGFFTIIHVILITYYLHYNFNNKTGPIHYNLYNNVDGDSNYANNINKYGHIAIKNSK